MNCGTRPEAIPRHWPPTVWWLRTEHIDDACERWSALLDAQERDRAQRFVSTSHRKNFVACHALLRLMLSRVVDVPPCEWKFVEGRNGKPRIAPQHGLLDLHFNIAHTVGVVAAGVACRNVIGVDVETVDPSFNGLDLVTQYFSGAEIRLLDRTPDFARPLTFTRLWTLKEAYLKATGAGLTVPLDSIAFDLDPLRITSGPDASDIAGTWQFASHRITEQHVLSVALRAAPEKAEPILLQEVFSADL